MSETTPRSVATEMKEAAARYVAAFERWSANGSSGDPAWLAERRKQAIARFADVGFPTTRQEEWRFTDVKPIARTGFVEAAEAAVSDWERHLLGGGDQHLAVFVNSRFSKELSSLGDLPGEARVGGLRSAFESEAQLIERHLTQYAATERSSLAALNTAFLGDGAFVYVPEKVVMDRPIHLLFLAVPSTDHAVVQHPRSLVITGRAAEATVVESYATVGGGVHWTNAVTEVVVGENAKLDTFRVQRESSEAYHTAMTHSHQQRDSVYSFVTFTFGANLSRHDIFATLDGEGAECTLDGLSLLRGRQHADYHTTLEHAQPNCNSWEYFNGVFDNDAHGVFNGRIIVRPGAQKTDSKQTNNSLLLSERARADSQPQLEIYADDVRCTHGATLGPIDDDHMFYLQSRGLTRSDALAMLTYGFASEILRAVSEESLRSDLDVIVHEWLSEATTADSD
jgi:Fe-S cluster assembly protein SufD